MFLDSGADALALRGRKYAIGLGKGSKLVLDILSRLPKNYGTFQVAQSGNQDKASPVLRPYYYHY
jgi:hypothetical protein